MVNITILASGYSALMTAFNYDTEAKALTILNTTATDLSPSWLAAAPNGGIIAALETTVGGLQSFTLNDDFTLANHSRTDNHGIPVNCAVLKSGTEVVTANYDNGQVVSYSLDKDGYTLGDAINGTLITGSGPVAGRQDGPHPHHIVEHDDEVLISDLGSDMVWRLQKQANSSWEVVGKVPQKAGSGPRHIAVTKNKQLFVAAELANTLSYYLLPDLATTTTTRKRSAKFRRTCNTTDTGSTSGTDPNFMGSLSVLPPDPPAGASWGAGEILLSPDEKYIYVSNRNVGTTDERGDPIAIFTVEPFKLVGHVYTGLTHVRGMIFGGDDSSDTAKYVAAAGQDGGGIRIYTRGDDGNLTEVSSFLPTDKNETQGVSTLLWRLPDTA